MPPQKRQSAFNRALREAQAQSSVSSDQISSQPLVHEEENGDVLQHSSLEDRSKVTQHTQNMAEEQCTEEVVPVPREANEEVPLSSPLHSEEVTQVTPLHSEKGVPPLSVSQQKGLEKTTFYMRPEHLDKLDDLAHDYRKKTGKRINRNDLVRYLIDHCALDTFLHDGKGAI